MILTPHGPVYTLARLMSGLPQFFEPARLAQRGELLTGELGLNQFPRLRELLHDVSGTVSIRLGCTQAEGGRYRIQGELGTTLRVQCQRCLGTFELPVQAKVDALAAPECADDGNTEAEADVWMCGDDNQVHLGNFIEDELILAVPLAPRHPPGACPVAEYHAQSRPERENPFAALKSLQTKKD